MDCGGHGRQIKSSIRKRKTFSGGGDERHRFLLDCLVQHVLGDIHTDHVLSKLGQGPSREPGSATDVDRASHPGYATSGKGDGLGMECGSSSSVSACYRRADERIDGHSASFTRQGRLLILLPFLASRPQQRNTGKDG